MRASGADVVILAAPSRRTVLAAYIEAGACGWIDEAASLDDAVCLLSDVVAGRPLLGPAAREELLTELRDERASARDALAPFDGLTAQERCVLAALADGQCADEIAAAHVVALTTVRSQIRAVLRKLGVRSQLAAVAQANRVGWQPPEDCRARRGGTEP